MIARISTEVDVPLAKTPPTGNINRKPTGNINRKPTGNINRRHQCWLPLTIVVMPQSQGFFVFRVGLGDALSSDTGAEVSPFLNFISDHHAAIYSTYSTPLVAINGKEIKTYGTHHLPLKLESKCFQES